MTKTVTKNNKFKKEGQQSDYAEEKQFFKADKSLFRAGNFRFFHSPLTNNNRTKNVFDLKNFKLDHLQLLKNTFKLIYS